MYARYRTAIAERWLVLRTWLPGLSAALFVSRVVVELAPARWPWPLSWSLGIGLATAAWVAVKVTQYRGMDPVPLVLLGGYALWPVIDPRLAAAIAFIVIVAVLCVGRDGISPYDRLLDAAVFLIALGAYGTTLAPGLLPADSGEFQLVAPTLGIAHPPGYALYTLVGKLFTLIPLRTPAWRLNLLSAVLAAATLVLVSRTTRHLTRSRLAGLVAALALAGATTFWAQATTANIRMPTAFFTALLLWLLVRYGETRASRHLIATAFVFGLAVTHHGSLAFLALPAALFLLITDRRVVRRGRLLLKAALAFGAALLVLLYFPLRSALGDPPLDPGGLTTLNGFLDHVLARGFRGDVLYFTGRDVLLDRLAVLLDILRIQFGGLLLGMAAVGLVPPLPRSLISNLQSQWMEDWRLETGDWALLTLTALLTALIAITYRAPQTVEYLMPTYVALAMLIGIGAARLAANVPSSQLRTILLAVLLLPGALNVQRIAPSFTALHQREDTRAVVEPVLRDAPPGATILANWHWATAFWYLQTVEGQRPEVAVEYIAPAGAEPYPETWRRRLREAVAEGPVIVTNRYATYADLPFRLVPFHQAFLVTTEPTPVPADATPVEVTFGDTLRLVAYALSPTQVFSGGTLTPRLWWQPIAPAAIERDYSVFVHLARADGVPVGQQDVTYPAAVLRRGGLFEDVYPLPVLPTVPPGDYTLLAGVYFRTPQGGFQRLMTPDGRDAVQLATVHVAPRQTPPVTRRPLHLPFAGGPTLVGVDYDTSRTDSTRVYLHWRLSEASGPWTAVLTANGQPVAQTQIADAPAGTFLTTALDVPPGTTRVRLTLRDGAGAVLRPLGPWRLPRLARSVALPPVRSGERYLVFGGEMALVNAEVRSQDDEAIADLTWLSLRPLLRDYTVSVQLRGDGWRAQHDGTPALGAIPTLKWIRGTQVTDRHRIRLPEDATGRAEVQISVYDAFTQMRLGVLDARLQRAGQGQAAVIGEVEIPLASTPE